MLVDEIKGGRETYQHYDQPGTNYQQPQASISDPLNKDREVLRLTPRGNR